MKTKTRRAIGEKQIEAIEKVLDYLWHDEGLNYENDFSPSDQRNHIFRSLRVLDAWLAGK